MANWYLGSQRTRKRKEVAGSLACQLACLATVCNGLPRCHGLQRFVTVCHGLPRFATVCHGLPRFVTVCHGLPRIADHGLPRLATATVCRGLPNFCMY